MTRARTFLTRVGSGLASLAVLLALAVAAPYALWLLAGWPLPASVPPFEELGDGLTNAQIPDSFIVGVLAVIGWIAWAQLMVSLFVELVAWIRRRPSPHIGLAGPIQPFVRRLVASAALLISSTASTAAGATPLARLAAEPPTEVVDVAPSPDVPEPRPARPQPTETAPAPLPTYTVVRRDTLWGLAEQYLGDPLRWREIFEQNRGVPQPDGGSLQDPNLIIPGWVLAFPPDAIGLAAPPLQASSVLEAPSTPPEVQSADEDVVPTAETPPPADDCSPEDDPGVDDTEPGPAVTAAPNGAEPADTSEAEAADADNESDSQIAIRLIGSSLAAACLVALLARLRRIRQRRRNLGTRPRPPRPDLEETELRLRHEADLDAAEFLDLALRAFAAGCTTGEGPPPRVLAVRAREDEVEILLDEALTNPPTGFTETGDSRGWRSDPDLDMNSLKSIAAESAAPLPSLVSLGTIDDGELLVDIETMGLLTVAGEPNRVAGLIHAVATQLAASTWVDHVDVILIGSASIDIAGAARVRTLSTLEEGLAELERTRDSIAEALALGEQPSTFAARLSDSQDDGWIPTILISAEPVGVDDLGRLDQLVGDGSSGVGAVVPSSRAATWHAQVDGAVLRLMPLGFEITPTQIDEHTLEALDDVLTESAVGEDEPVSSEQAEPLSSPSEEASASDALADIEIRVLGPVEISGIDAPFARRKCEEMAVYLALHPEGVSHDRLRTVLWPDQTPKDGTFNTTVSMTRRCLGQDKDGEPHLPRFQSAGHKYRVGEHVTTDLALFEAHIAATRALPPEDSTDRLRSALELVRGQAFAETRGYEWAYSEGLVANIEAAIADAAHALATICLDCDDAEGATWAAMQGLKAAPGDEILYRDRMLACDLAGNPAGAETVMSELCEVIEGLEPYDSLHPETLRLYEQLSHRRRAPSSA